MNVLINYLHQLTLMGWLIIIAFGTLAVIAVYSQFRKRRSTEK